MAAEAIAVLILVQETADTVTSVVKAINEVKGLLGGFNKQKDRTPEILQCIEKAKQEIIDEIQKSELEERLNTLYASADDWFTTLDKIVDLAGKEKEGKVDTDTVKAVLTVIWGSMLQTIKELNKTKYYFEGPRPKPKTPEMLSVTFLCYSLLHSFVLASDAVYAKLNGTITPNLATGIEELEASSLNMNGYIGAYKDFRKRQISFKEIVEHEPGSPPWHTGEYKIISDVGGDTAIPNLTNKTWIPSNGIHSIGDGIIETYWSASNFGQEVPHIFHAWDELHTKTKGVTRSFYIRHKQK